MSEPLADVAAQLKSLLHPRDKQDIPVPGFPTGDALNAWVATKPHSVVVEALVEVLRRDSVPQQLAAASALRSLSIDVDGRSDQGTFHWHIDESGVKQRLVPAVPPDLSHQSESFVEFVGNRSRSFDRRSRSLIRARVLTRYP
jgi:hypothetical protein